MIEKCSEGCTEFRAAIQEQLPINTGLYLDNSIRRFFGTIFIAAISVKEYSAHAVPLWTI
jgi:hypothetical protein